MTIPSCELDAGGLAAQRDRYARLGGSVVEIERRDGELSVRFDPGYDRALLDEALAVERACCPFFVFGLDEAASTLRVGVRDAEQAPALDALHGALSPPPWSGASASP